MYSDEDDRQMTLGAFSASPPELAREAAQEHRDHTERLARAGVRASELEQVVYGGETVDVREWFDLSPDAQADLLDRRLELLKDELKADDEPVQPEPLGPTDYQGRRPENAPGEAWGYD